MTRGVEPCPECGGIHYGQLWCPYGDSPQAIRDRQRSEKRSKQMTAEAEMPTYRCHKKVHALKIKEVCDTAKPNEETDGSLRLVFDERGYGDLVVPWKYVRKHTPKAGGYYVVYQDGYASFSPGDVFEDGYTRINPNGTGS